MRVAFQMDSWAVLNFSTDSTVALAYEAYKSGYEIFSFEAKDMIYSMGKLWAWGQQAHFIDQESHHQQAFRVDLHPVQIQLESMDILFIRNEPPVDMAYQTALYLLQHLDGKVMMVNNPTGLLMTPEKLVALNWPQWTPKTVIAKNKKTVYEMIEQWKKVVLKPLFGKGGDGVYLVHHLDTNLDVIIQSFFSQYKEPWIIQEYLPNIEQGDIRVLLCNGEVLSAFKRVPKQHSILSNLAAGAHAEPVTLQDKDYKLIQDIKPYLLKHKLFFVGCDFIDGHLIEINVTCPTGLKTADSLYSQNTSKMFWDTLLALYKSKK